jgi:hypothetical protein
VTGEADEEEKETEKERIYQTHHRRYSASLFDFNSPLQRITQGRVLDTSNMYIFGLFLYINEALSWSEKHH